MEQYYLAVDIGASSGRHILGWQEDGVLKLEEIYRFENGYAEQEGKKLWDTGRLFAEILNGMKQCSRIGKIPVSMAIDTWAVITCSWMVRIRWLETPTATGTAGQREWTKQCPDGSYRKRFMSGPASRNRCSTRSTS